MPTVFMTCLQTNISMYTDNAMTIASPVNQYMELAYAISNLSRMGQPQGGLGYIPQVMPHLTNSSLLVVRQ